MESEDQIKENIEKYGWQCQFVFDDEGDKQDFGYSIGFEETFGHPEVIVFGLKRETMHGVLSGIAYDLKQGCVFEPEKRIKDVISGDYEVLFKPLREELFDEYVGMATRYYQRDFRVLVMFWPDKNNVLPTEPNCELTVQNEALEIV